MDRRTLLTVLLVIALVGVPAVMTYTSVERTAATVPENRQPDPSEDVIGWENGYWYNESISVDQSDGLRKSERKAFVARGMARVEYLRQLEFTQNVTIEPISRDELPSVATNTTFYNDTTFGAPTNEQLWEALFLIDEPTNATNATNAIRQYQTAVVLGYAAEEGANRIVIVTEDSKNPVIGGITLIHELTHMLQHQHFDLSRQKYRPDTLDGEFAKNGLVEGGATYVHEQYARKCDDEWDCVDAPRGWSNLGRSNNSGLSRLFSQPYSDGPVYVNQLVQRGGWAAVNATYESPPTSTEQIIHRDRPRDPLTAISFNDTSRNGWTVVEQQQGKTYQRVGEAGIYTLFWYQANRYDIQALEEQISTETDRPFDTYNYTSVFSAGWGNDRLVAYKNGAKRGYVWKTTWDTQKDAVEFYEAYRRVLQAHDAVQRKGQSWLIENGSFADAFRIVRDGKTVTVVNGPTVSDVKDIRPQTGPVTRSSALPTSRRLPRLRVR